MYGLADVVGVKDVAARAGVSVGTVSNVLNRPEIVSEAPRSLVMAAIDELAFVRNESARELSPGRSRTIGLIVLDVGNSSFTDLARGKTSPMKRVFCVVLGNSADDISREEKFVTLLDERRFQGVFIDPVGESSERLERLRKRGIHAVLVDRLADPPEFCSVSVNAYAGGQLAASHLLEQGHRRVLFVCGPITRWQVRDREAGARAAAAEVADAKIGVSQTAALSADEGKIAGRAIAALPVAKRPHAVFAATTCSL